MTIKRYGVVIEGDETGYSAYVPDLPGCIGAGDTFDETREDVQSAIDAHLRWMLRDGDPIPEPSDVIPVDIPNASVTFVEVDVPAPRQVHHA